MYTNTQILLKNRPNGLPKDSDFSVNEQSVEPLKEGEILVKNKFISLDPAMRGWMNEGRSYIPPVQLGDVMRAFTVGEVVESRDETFQSGDYVSGMLNVQEYAVSSAKKLEKLDTSALKPSNYLSALGIPGLTAYFGLLESGEYRPGETVLVSGAAGAVGSMVGQIAKLHGSTVIGIAGGEKKCDYVVNELGFDACIDYKKEELKSAIRTLCKQYNEGKGVDVYFDNVGGETLEAALANIALNAKIVICGAISQYNSNGEMKGPANYMSLLVNRATMRGMVVFDYVDQYAKAQKDIADWIASGKIQFKEDVIKGITQFPVALNALFSGKNFGKMILEL